MTSDNKNYKQPAFSAKEIDVVCSEIAAKAYIISKIATNDLEKRENVLSDIVPQLPMEINTRVDNDRTFIFQPKVQRIFEINTTGSKILTLVDGKRTIKDIAIKLSTETNTNLQDIIDDVIGFLYGLRNAGFEIKLG
jgi:hypothetical protein